MIEITKTINLPIAMEATKRKKDIINSISERVTYAVQLYLDKIVENDITKLSEVNQFQKKTGLSAGFVQCGIDGDVVGSINNIMLKGITKSPVSRKTRMVGAVVTQSEVWMKGLKKIPEYTISH